MSVELEALELHITSSSDEAVNGIERLIATLDRLRTQTRGGVGLSTVARQLERVNVALSHISTDTSRLTNLSDTLSNLSAIRFGNNSLNTIRRQITNLNDAVNNLNFNPQRLYELRDATQSLADIERAAGLQSVVNALNKLPTVMQQLEQMDMARFAQIIQDVSASLEPLATQMDRVSRGFAAFPIRIQRLIANNTALAGSNRFLANSFGFLGRATQMVSFYQVAKWMASWVTESNDYVENLNLFTVAMGDQADAAYAYAMKVNSALGIDYSEWMRNQGVFKQITSGFGVVEDKANLMSQNLTQLGYDISSFFNISIEEAMQKVQSGISGELEPLRRLGYALDVATLQEIAHANGITKSVNAMTQAEKSQLRYLAMIEQSTNVMGDMARTVQTPANAMRILGQQITQLSRALGNLLIPMIQTLIPWVQAAVEILTDWVNVLAVLVGFKLPKIDYSGLDGVSAGAVNAESALDDATGAAKDLKHELMGIDELTVLNDPNKNASGAGSGDALAGIELPSYDFLEGLDEQVSNIKKKLEPVLAIVLAIGTAFLAWQIGTAIMTGLTTLSTFLGGVSISVRAIKDAFLLLNGQAIAATAGAAGLAKVLKFAGVVGVIMTIIGRIVDLWYSSENFRTGIKRIGEVIEGVFTVGGEILKGIGTVLGDIAMGFVNLLPEPVKQVIIGAIDSIRGVIADLELDWGDLLITVGGLALLFVPGGQILGAVLLGFEAITIWIRNLGGMSEETWEGIKTTAKNAFDKVKQHFVDDWNATKTFFNEEIAPLFSLQTWLDVLSGIKTAFSTIWTGAVNTAIKLINKFIGWVNDRLDISWDAKYLFGQKIFDAGSVKLVNIPTIPLLAEGGMVDTGQLFIANEAGPELIGTFGSRTAVANQGQIVDGISHGVEMANRPVVSAILTAASQIVQAVNENGGDLILDGDSLTRRVTQNQNRLNRMYGKTLQMV